MTPITPEILERALRDKYYWRKLASQIISESSQNVPKRVTFSDSGEARAPPIPLGRIHETNLRQTRARLSSSDPGPKVRVVPMISEFSTVSSIGVVSEKRAQRWKQLWNNGRLTGQEQVQRGRERGEEEEEDSDFPLKDHPQQSCDSTHPGQTHDDYMADEEEEEEENLRSVNPLYRQNSAGARSISKSRRTREREK
jgi:hypothetical protein